MENKMATHSSILAWRIPWTEEERGGLQSMGSQIVGHDWVTIAYSHIYMYMYIDTYIYVYIYILFKIFFSTLVYYRILTMLPCAIQQDRVMYLLYIQ